MNRSLSIVIPAYNEAGRLPETLRRIQAWLDSGPWIFREIVVVDDGSRDGTGERAEEFAAACPDVRVLRNSGNHGKGYSVRQGMLAARGEWILFTDADLSAPIGEMEKLWAAVQPGPGDEVAIAIGSRAIDRSLIGIHQPGFRENAGKFFNLVMRIVTGLGFHDTQCGFKLFRRDAAREIFRRQRLERFGFDVEILFIAKRLGYKAVEIPVRWNHMEGSKVGVLSGLNAFLELAEIRLNSLRGYYR